CWAGPRSWMISTPSCAVLWIGKPNCYGSPGRTVRQRENCHAGVHCRWRRMARMRFLWPKSLSGLMLLGIAVIAVPLLVAIFNAALQIQQLADSSRTVASAGIGSARASEDLMSGVLLLERATVLVLADSKNRDVYRELDAQLTASREQLAHQLNSAEGRQALAQLGGLQTRI